MKINTKQNVVHVSGVQMALVYCVLSKWLTLKQSVLLPNVSVTI